MNPPPDKDNEKKPWFGPKRYGVGLRPSSRRGWLVIVLMVIVETIIVTTVPAWYPSWFAAKTIGYGFTPATWQGWAVTLGPPLIIIAAIRYLYHKQNKHSLCAGSD
jgi:hypothetical protein